MMSFFTDDVDVDDKLFTNNIHPDVIRKESEFKKVFKNYDNNFSSE